MTAMIMRRCVPRTVICCGSLARGVYYKCNGMSQHGGLPPAAAPCGEAFFGRRAVSRDGKGSRGRPGQVCTSHPPRYCSPLPVSTSHMQCTCRVVAGLGTAVRALQLAPVETAKAVAVTLDGTSAMLGQACGQLGAAAKQGLEGSAQRLGVTSRQAKASFLDLNCKEEQYLFCGHSEAPVMQQLNDTLTVVTAPCCWLRAGCSAEESCGSGGADLTGQVGGGHRRPPRGAPCRLNPEP